MINEPEAEQIRQIYQRYLVLGSVRLLKQELDQQGVVSKVRLSRKGSNSGGKSFSRGALYELLSNPIYIGEIRHKQEHHPGQHEPILEGGIWQQVQQRLGNAARRGSDSISKAPASPLAGKVFDEHGEPLYTQGAAKGGKRYRYFVSRGLVRGPAAQSNHGWRVPAPELERMVLSGARSIMADQATLMAGLQDLAEDGDPEQILAIAADWRQRLSTEGEALPALARTRPAGTTHFVRTPAHS